MDAPLPAAFDDFDEELRQAPAGAPGKVGTLSLGFERKGHRTQLSHLHSSGPQRVHRVLYLDDGLPDMAVVFIQSVGGGILQGDRLWINIDLAPGARALVTTQSATKVYRMERNYATLLTDVRVDRGAYLELMTDYFIPFKGSRLYNQTACEVHTDGTFIYSESIAPGRVAFGEQFEYQLFYSRLIARDFQARLRCADTMVLKPQVVDPHRPGILGAHSDLGSLYVLTHATKADDLAKAMRDRTVLPPIAEGAVSTLPHLDGAFARVLGNGQSSVQLGVHQAWAGARRQILGSELPPLHRIKYGFDLPRTTAAESNGSLPAGAGSFPA
jgi:urease accessory protein